MDFISGRRTPDIEPRRSGACSVSLSRRGGDLVPVNRNGSNPSGVVDHVGERSEPKRAESSKVTAFDAAASFSSQKKLSMQREVERGDAVTEFFGATLGNHCIPLSACAPPLMPARRSTRCFLSCHSSSRHPARSSVIVSAARSRQGADSEVESIQHEVAKIDGSLVRALHRDDVRSVR